MNALVGGGIHRNGRLNSSEAATRNSSTEANRLRNNTADLERAGFFLISNLGQSKKWNFIRNRSALSVERLERRRGRINYATPADNVLDQNCWEPLVPTLKSLKSSSSSNLTDSEGAEIRCFPL